MAALSHCSARFADHAATTFGPNSVWVVNRPANSAVLVTHLARHPILWKNVFFWRDRNDKPHVPDRSRPCATFWRRLRGQPRQPIRSIPESVEVIRGAASNAVARRVWNPRCNFRQRVHFVRIRNPRHRGLHAGTGDGSRLIGCDQSLRCGRHRYQQPNRAGKGGSDCRN
jgi:hypothetical protein